VVVLCVFPMVLDWWLGGVWIACVVHVRVRVREGVCFIWLVWLDKCGMCANVMGC